MLGLGGIEKTTVGGDARGGEKALVYMQSAQRVSGKLTCKCARAVYKQTAERVYLEIFAMLKAGEYAQTVCDDGEIGEAVKMFGHTQGGG